MKEEQWPIIGKNAGNNANGATTITTRPMTTEERDTILLGMIEGMKRILAKGDNDNG